MADVASIGILELFTNAQPHVVRTMFAAAMRSALERVGPVPDPSYALGHERNIYEVVRRDAALDHAMTLAMHAMAGSGSCYQPAAGGEDAKAIAELGTKMLERIDNLDEAKLSAATGLFFGSSFGLVRGRREKHDWVDGIPRDWWVCTEVRDVDRRRVRYQRPVGDPKGDPFTLHYADVRQSDASSQDLWKPVTRPEWMIRYVHENREATLGSGRGLLDSMFVYWYAKTNLLQFMLRGAETWGEGRLVVKVDPERPGATDKDNATLLEDSAEAVAKSKARHVMACLATESIENIGADGTGFDMILKALQYVDDAALRLCMGSSMPFGGGGDKETGSNARSMTEQDTSESLMRVRRRGLESSWSRTLTPLFFGLNRANLVSCGLAAAPLPRMSFTRDADVDPAQEVEAVTALLNAGVMLDAAETYERLGRKMPETAPEVLEGKPDPTAIGPDGEPIAPDVPGGPRAMPKDDAEVAAASDAVLARFDAMSGRLDSMAARDPVVNVHLPPITIPDIHIPAPQITVNAPPAPDVNVTVEAAKPVDVTVNVAPTPVTVENTVNVPKGAAPVVKVDAPIIPPALVTVAAPKFRRTRTKISRDSSGEIASTETVED